MALLLLALLAGCPGGRSGGETAAGPPNAHTTLEAGQVVSLRGVVTKNVRACEVDGPCFLEMRCPESPGPEVLITALYAEARGIPCPNEAAVRAGLQTEAGDEIEVRGLATGPDRLTTCDSDDYFIRSTNPTS